MAARRRTPPGLSAVVTAPFVEALPVVLDAWRSTRHPRLADLVGFVDDAARADAPRAPLAASKKRADVAAWAEVERQHDVLDFERLMNSARAGTQADVLRQVNALAKWGDPRLGPGLLRLLEKPPYAGLASRELLAKLLKALEATGDRRMAEAARALGGRYLGIVNSSTGGWVAAELEALAGRLDSLVPPELSAEDAVACSALEARLGPQVADQVRARSTAQHGRSSLAPLFDAVFAAPEDDGPRLVLADALTEQGDARGEFISLQVARARGLQTPAQAQREAELAAEPNRLAQWAQPLAHGGSCTFARGFPAEVSLYRGAEKHASEPAWATVTHLDGLGALSHKAAVLLLSQPALAGLRTVGLVPAQVINALPPTPRAWTALSVSSAHLLRADALACAPALRALTLRGEGPIAEGLLAPLAELREVTLTGRAGTTVPRDLLRPLTRLANVTLELAAVDAGLVWPGSVASLTIKTGRLPKGFVLPPGLRSFSLHADQLALGAQPPLLQLERASFHLQELSRVELDVLPRLKHLSLELQVNPRADLLASQASLEALELRLQQSAAAPSFAACTGLRTLALDCGSIGPDGLRGLVALRELELFTRGGVPPRLFEHTPALEVVVCSAFVSAPAQGSGFDCLPRLRVLGCFELPLREVPARRYERLAVSAPEELEDLAVFLKRMPLVAQLELVLGTSALSPSGGWSDATSTYVRRSPEVLAANWKRFATLLEASAVSRCVLDAVVSLVRDGPGPFSRVRVSKGEQHLALASRALAAFSIVPGSTGDA